MPWPACEVRGSVECSTFVHTLVFACVPCPVLFLLVTVVFYLLAPYSDRPYYTFVFLSLVPVLNSSLATFLSYLSTVHLFSIHLSFVPIA